MGLSSVSAMAAGSVCHTDCLAQTFKDDAGADRKEKSLKHYPLISDIGVEVVCRPFSVVTDVVGKK